MLIRHFFGRLTESPPSKCTLTFARSFGELSLNLCENIPIRTQPSAEGASEEKHTPGALVFCQLAKPHFWKLGCCTWSLFLEASESNVRQCQQGCASGCGEASPLEARLLPMKGMVNVQTTAPHSEPNQNQTEILRYPSPAAPRAL